MVDFTGASNMLATLKTGKSGGLAGPQNHQILQGGKSAKIFNSDRNTVRVGIVLASWVRVQDGTIGCRGTTILWWGYSLLMVPFIGTLFGTLFETPKKGPLRDHYGTTILRPGDH